jgi:acetylornithine deacetylase
MATTIGAARSFTAIELLDRLIGYDTTSRNSNLGLIEFVRGHLEAWGVPCRLSYDPTGTKANIHAIIGPISAGGLALSGHVDTVPVDGQAWSGDPFTMRRDQDRLYGRGATDMKGFVACMLAAVPDLVALKPRRPIHLLITYDEEIGCSGVQRLIADWDESRLQPISSS